MSRSLAVWLHNRCAGTLQQDNSGRLIFQYEPDYLQAGHPPLSVSLPLQDEPFRDRQTKPFFSGLLPDEAARARLANILGVSDKNPFALLEAVGGECAGAVALLPWGVELPVEDEADFEILDDDRLQDLLTELRQNPLLARHSGVRLSLAGAQDKLAVQVKGTRIQLMLGGAATTHILKPMIDQVTESVANEFFCLSLAKRIGLPAPQVEAKVAGKTPYLLVERYDRQIQSGQILRLHQEDFCQALGIPPELKYESEGGPGITQCLTLLQNHSRQPAADQRSFLERLCFSVLLGNMDAHGKNYALLYPPPSLDDRPALAPVYDVLSTEVYPQLSNRLAMKIGKKKYADDLYLRHWETLVPDTALARRNLHQRLKRLAEEMQSQSLELMAELGDRGLDAPVFSAIHQMIEGRSQKLLQQLP